jgi:hypothetical protein
MTRPFLTSALWLALGCASPTGPADSPLRVTAADAAVQLENLSERPVFYFVYERGAAALINWSACVEPDCPAVAPGTRASVPYRAIGGYAPGKREAVVWWWEAVPGPADGPVASAVHAVVVGL